MDNPRIEKLRDALVASPCSYAIISRESGIERSWLGKFAKGTIPDITVTRFDTLKSTMDRLGRRVVNG